MKSRARAKRSERSPVLSGVGGPLVLAWQNRHSLSQQLIPLAARVLQSIVDRAPARVQTIATTGLRRAARRWPILLRLLGGTVEPESVAPARAGRRQAPAPAAAPRDPAATARLVAALRDTTAEVAVEAAEALAHHPPELATPALQEVLANRDGYFNTATRAAAVRALGSLLPRGEGAAIAAATTDPDASVSLAAIAALVERGEEAGAAPLLRLLEDTTGFFLALTRQAAARGLARLGHADQDRVGALLRTEEDAIVREALGSLRAARTVN